MCFIIQDDWDEQMDKKDPFWHLTFVYHLSHVRTALYSRQRKLSPFFCIEVRLSKVSFLRNLEGSNYKVFSKIAAREAAGWCQQIQHH